MEPETDRFVGVGSEESLWVEALASLAPCQGDQGANGVDWV